jgi:hypothetical protein
MVTAERIEGRMFVSPGGHLDWKTCSYSAPPEWSSFTFVPVKSPQP